MYGSDRKWTTWLFLSIAFCDLGRVDAARGRFVPLAIDLTAKTDQLNLLLFGAGIRGFRSEIFVLVGGRTAPITGVAAQSEYAGLDQFETRCRIGSYSCSVGC
jgi:hypothetical protein